MLRSPTRAALVMALALGAVVTLTPANGAAGDIATGFVRAVRHLTAPSSRDGQAFSGTPPVGALFTRVSVPTVVPGVGVGPVESEPPQATVAAVSRLKAVSDRVRRIRSVLNIGVSSQCAWWWMLPA